MFDLHLEMDFYILFIVRRRNNVSGDFIIRKRKFKKQDTEQRPSQVIHSLQTEKRWPTVVTL